METILKNLECYKIVHSDNDKKLVLHFVDEESGCVYKVNYNQQKYVNDDYVDDEKTAEAKKKMLLEDTGFEWDQIDQFKGQRKDVYYYSGARNFSSLHHVTVVEKFTKDQDGEMFNTAIKEIVVDRFGIHIRYDWNGTMYQSNMSFGDWESEDGESRFLVDPSKKGRQEAKFQEYYGVPADRAQELIGKEIVVEVISKAKGKILYGEIKKPKWGKA